MEYNKLVNMVLTPDWAYRNEKWKYYSMDFHAHGFLEINYIFEGSCTYIIGKTTYVLQKKNLLILDSRIPHKKIFDHSVPCVVYGCSFDMKEPVSGFGTLEDLLNESPILSALLADINEGLVMEDGSFIFSDLAALQSEIAGSRNPYYIQALGVKMLIDIARRYTNPVSNRAEYVLQIKEYIRLHFDQIDSLAQIADSVGLNQTYAERLFKKETGCTIWNYLIHYRLEVATNLLQYPDIPIGEIDARIGMNSRQTFYIQFRKKYGLSPQEYRKNTKGE